MSIPHRNNPKLVTNWHNTETKKFLNDKEKRAYYDMSVIKKPGKLVISMREEKKRLGGSQECEEHWYGGLEFDLDSTFAKDLKMFLNEYVEGNSPEVEAMDTDVVRVTRQEASEDSKIVSSKTLSGAKDGETRKSTIAIGVSKDAKKQEKKKTSQA